MSRAAIVPRLLTRDQAASYLGFSRAAFERHCSVVPLRFGDDRLVRWDRHDLDAWIDALKHPVGSAGTVMTLEDMERAMEAFEG